MSFAFKNPEDLYASDYIERKRALNNYQYFKKRLDNSNNKALRPKTISNYNGTTYFMRDDISGISHSKISYYLAHTHSYDHLLSITKGSYLLPTVSKNNKADASCTLCPDISNNLEGELYEANDYTVNSLLDSPLYMSSFYPEISDCEINTYNIYIKSDTIKFNDASYINKKYSYPQFKFPSTLRQ